MPSQRSARRGRHLKRVGPDGQYRRPNWPTFRAGRGARFLAPIERGLPPDPSLAAADDGGPVVTQLSISVIVRGREMSLSPEEIDALDLYDLEEVARPASYFDMPNMVGKFPVLTHRGYTHVWFESNLESDHYQELVWAGIDELNAQCMEFHAEFSDHTVKARRPDAVVRRGGRTVVIDITNEAALDDEKAASYDFAADVCAAVGWGYAVGTDVTLSKVRRANLGFLTQAEDLDIEPLGEEAPWDFGELADAYGSGGDGRLLALAALWRKHYWIDMEVPLEDTSVLVPDAPGPVLFPWRLP